jgi:hypothetical protein
MIKRYNQFVKGRVNENIDDMEDINNDGDLGYATHDGSFGGDDSELESEIQNTEIAKNSFEEEEESGDVYSAKMKELANMLGSEVTDKNTIEYNGTQIIYPSETEMYHVGKKKFKTSQEVKNYLKNDVSNIKSDVALQESKSYRKRYK